MLIYRPASPYASAYALGGLGATGYSCTSTVCVGSTTAMKAVFSDLQTQLNAVLATLPSPPAPLVVDGKLGKNTVTAVGLAATMATSYGTLVLTTLRTYTKPPTKEQVAASAAKLVAELKTLLAERLKATGPDPTEEALAALGPAAQAAAAAAEEAAAVAADTAMVSGKDSAPAKAAATRAATAQAAAVAAMDKAKAAAVAPTLPGLNTDKGKLLYGIGALALLYFGYRMHMDRKPRAAAAAPAPTSAPVAGLRGPRRSRRTRYVVQVDSGPKAGLWAGANNAGYTLTQARALAKKLVKTVLDREFDIRIRTEAASWDAYSEARR